MQILVVGAGWLGSKVAERMSCEHLVVATFRNNAPDLENVLAFKFVPGEPLPVFDTVVLSFPPDRRNNRYLEDCMAIVSKQNEETRFLMCSSTSVIGSQQECERLSENFSVIGDVERQLSNLLGDRLSIVRFGGLIGPGRLPIRRMLEKKSSITGNHLVNVIHREDAVEIIAHIIKNNMWGKIFAAVATGHPSKRTFYTEMSRSNKLGIPDFFDSETMNFAVHPEHLLNSGYVFKFPSPLQFPELLL